MRQPFHSMVEIVKTNENIKKCSEIVNKQQNQVLWTIDNETKRECFLSDFGIYIERLSNIKRRFIKIELA